MKFFVKGLLSGLAVLIVVGLVPVVGFTWLGAGRSWDPVSYVQHYSTVPSFWIKVLVGCGVALLVFAIGFYLPLRGKLSRQ